MESDTTTTAEKLREDMVAAVRKAGYAHRPEVERALLEVPRHDFVPEADLTTAYDPWNSVITHRHDDGKALSCASAPWLVAAMLDQAHIQPGNRILEIGAGTGYNAALLAHLTGQADLVTTIDINADVTAKAAQALTSTGYHGVHVITRDGALGHSDNAPYDRIIATVSPWDIPPAWWQQLAPEGRLVAPLRWRGLGQTVAFTYLDGALVADSMQLCGFVYLISDSEGELAGPITEDNRVSLHWDRDQAVDIESLRGVLDQKRVTRWSGCTIASGESHDGLWLRLTMNEPRVCRLQVDSTVPPELCDPVKGWWKMALVEDATLVYLTARRHKTDDEVRWELGAIGHGPAAGDLTEHLCNRIQQWMPTRTKPAHSLVVYPADIRPHELERPGTHIINKEHSRFVLSYPDTAEQTMPS